jgi:hypothetical protein
LEVPQCQALDTVGPFGREDSHSLTYKYRLRLVDPVPGDVWVIDSLKTKWRRSAQAKTGRGNCGDGDRQAAGEARLSEQRRRQGVHRRV